MTDIREAKQTLVTQLRQVDGYHGVGIAKSAIRVYARPDSPVVRLIRKRWGDRYRGHPLTVVPTSGFVAHHSAKRHAAN